jgi:hypothetical protein
MSPSDVSSRTDIVQLQASGGASVERFTCSEVFWNSNHDDLKTDLIYTRSPWLALETFLRFAGVSLAQAESLPSSYW